VVDEVEVEDAMYALAIIRSLVQCSSVRGRAGQRAAVCLVGQTERCGVWEAARAERETGLVVVEQQWQNGRRGGEELRWAGWVGEGARPLKTRQGLAVQGRG
jgi:hypothetical protein